MIPTSAPLLNASQLRPLRRLFLLVSIPALMTSGQAAIPVIQDPGQIVTNYVELMTDTEVAVQIFASDSPTSYGAIGLPSGLSIDSDTGLITGDVSSESFGIVTLTATNADGTGMLDVNFYIYQREPDNAQNTGEDIERGMDVNGNNMSPITLSPYNKETSGVDVDFFYRLTGAPPVGGTGSDLIRNNNTSDNSITGVQSYVRGPAQVSYRWRSNMEPFWDDFDFYINGILFATLDGFNTWATVAFDLGPGLHRLEWLYIKDINDWAGGANQCFLDELVVTGYPEWAEDENLTPFSSAFQLDLDGDGNNLLLEYALDLKSDREEMVFPLLTFEPDGRAILEIGKNKDAYGVTVDIEKSTLLTPGSWSPVPDTVTNSSSTLIKRESTAQPAGNYRVNVTSP